MRNPLTCTILGLLLVARGVAAELPIQNPSFEQPAIAPGTFATTASPPGWTTFGNLNLSNRTVGVLNPNTTTLYTAAIPHGSNVGVVFLLDNFANQAQFANQPAGMQQTLAATLQPSTRYTLSVAVGNIANDVNPPHNQFQFDGFPGYRIDLLAGGVILASDVNTLLPPAGGFVTASITIDIGTSHPQAGQPLGIRLINQNGAPGLEVNFDDVHLDALSPWTDLGHAKPGSAGSPLLRGAGPLQAGITNQIELTDALPGSAATLIFGLSQVDLPLLQGVLVPAPQLVLALPTNAAGALTLPFALPAGFPPGTALYFQFWIPDAGASLGVAASNGLRGVSS